MEDGPIVNERVITAKENGESREDRGEAEPNDEPNGVPSLNVMIFGGVGYHEEVRDVDGYHSAGTNAGPEEEGEVSQDRDVADTDAETFL